MCSHDFENVSAVANCAIIVYYAIASICYFSVCRLVAGDVEGNIKQLFSKVQGILKKNGPFEVHATIQILTAHSIAILN